VWWPSVRRPVARRRGKQAGRRCSLPDHDDAYASCRVFGEAEQGWWCFGRAHGGRIYDLASLMSGGVWGRELRGEAFRSVKEMVAAAVR
jgi:hypothetical protein